jgi:large subunit ribosomal protein L25
MYQLNAEKRDVFGKKLKNFRKQGKLPAVLYGKNKKTASIFVDLKEFKKIWKETGESTIIKIILKSDFENSKSDFDVLIQEVVFGPIKDEPIHADFYIVEMDKPIVAKVSLVFEGVSPAEKDLGGILVKVRHDVEVEALPKNLPHELKVDVSKLVNLGDQITVKNINLPAGVKILAGENDVVALVEAPKEEIVEEKPITIEEVEVEKRGKKEEEKIEEGTSNA